MDDQLSRRRFLQGAGVTLGAGLAPAFPAWAAEGDSLTEAFRKEEERLGARFGAFIIDTQTGMSWSQRETSRFPMCSTFKVIAASAILARVDRGEDDLATRIRFDTSDVVPYSPVTEKRAGGDGMTLAEICEAALTQSDNTAGNILIDRLGGPSGVTEFARGMGDQSFRLDRRETALNEASPGDPRDTTTPAAMAQSLQGLILGETLSPASREQLTDWMLANRTGDAKLRAGLPNGWRVGDKTGGGSFGTMNDVAVIWPPKRRPIVASLYMTETEASFDDRNAAFARIGKAIAERIAV